MTEWSSPNGGCFTFQPCQIHQSPLSTLSNPPVTTNPNLLISFSKHNTHFHQIIITSVQHINKATNLAQFIRWCLFRYISSLSLSLVQTEHQSPESTSLMHPLQLHASHSSFHIINEQTYSGLLAARPIYVRIITGFWQVWNIFVWKGIQAVRINYWV